MVKTVLLLTLFSLILNASDYNKACTNCHEASNIPDIVIYKRYLLKYSNEQRVKNAIINYLKKPSKESSIMPSQFIDKFGFKEPSKLSDKELEIYVDEFVDRYNLKKRLYLK